MKLKSRFAIAILMTSLIPVAYADDYDIAMITIPSTNYEMGKTEVAQGQWKSIMGSNPSHFDSCGDTCPVESVSWNDVQEFIQKLNTKTGKQYRLPTNDEWQFACNGGSDNEYCGGDNLNQVGWFDGNSENQTHSVGFKEANGYGLYDMTGNVWEWMSDCNENSCIHRVLRGGSWYSGTWLTHAETRLNNFPEYRDVSIGFRLARTLP